MQVRKPVNARQAHKHMDAMLGKLPNTGVYDCMTLAKWSLTARLTPCEHYMVAVYILNWG